MLVKLTPVSIPAVSIFFQVLTWIRLSDEKSVYFDMYFLLPELLSIFLIIN